MIKINQLRQNYHLTVYKGEICSLKRKKKKTTGFFQGHIYEMKHITGLKIFMTILKQTDAHATIFLLAEWQSIQQISSSIKDSVVNILYRIGPKYRNDRIQVVFSKKEMTRWLHGCRFVESDEQRTLYIEDFIGEKYNILKTVPLP